MAAWVAALGLAAAAASEQPPPRLALPSQAEQTEAAQGVRESYAGRYAQATTPAQRALLAGEMLDAAVAEEEPGRRFALLKAAGNMAAQNGDAALAVGAVEVMAETFEFDAVQARVAMLRRVAAGASLPAQKAQLVRAVIEAFDEAVFTNRLDAMPQLVALGLSVAEEAGRIHYGPGQVLTPDVIHVNAAVCYMAFRRWEEVREHATALLAGPNAGNGHLFLGGCYEAAQDWANAEEHFREASTYDRSIEALYLFYRRTGRGDPEAVEAARRQLGKAMYEVPGFTLDRYVTYWQARGDVGESGRVARKQFLDTGSGRFGLIALMSDLRFRSRKPRDELLARFNELRAARARENPEAPPNVLFELASIFERDVRAGGKGELDSADLAGLFDRHSMAAWGDLHFFIGQYLDYQGQPEQAVEYWKKSMAHYVMHSPARTLAGARLGERLVEPAAYREWALRGLPADQRVIAQPEAPPELLADDAEPVPEIEPRELVPASPVVVVLPPLLHGRAPRGRQQAAELVCDLLAEQLDATGTARVVSRAELDRILDERRRLGDAAGPMLSFDALVRLEVTSDDDAAHAHLRLVDISTGSPLAHESFGWPIGRAGVARLVLACRAGLDAAPTLLEGTVRVRLAGLEAAQHERRMRPLGHRAHDVFAASIDQSDRLLLVENLEVASSREEAVLLAAGLSRLPGERQFSPLADATIEFRLAETDALGKTFEETEIRLGVRLRRGAAYQGDWMDLPGQVKDFDRMVGEAWAKVAAALAEAAPDAAREAIDAMALRRRQAETEYRAARAVDAKLPLLERARAKLVHLDAALRLDPGHERALYEAVVERAEITERLRRDSSPDPALEQRVVRDAVEHLERFESRPERRWPVLYAARRNLGEFTPERLAIAKQLTDDFYTADIRIHRADEIARQIGWRGQVTSIYGAMQKFDIPTERRRAWLEHVLDLAVEQAKQIEKIRCPSGNHESGRTQFLVQHERLRLMIARFLGEEGRPDRAREIVADVMERLSDPESLLEWTSLRHDYRGDFERILSKDNPDGLAALEQKREAKVQAQRASKPPARSIRWPQIGFFDRDKEAVVRPTYIRDQFLGAALDYPGIQPLGEIDGRLYLRIYHKQPVVAYLSLDAGGRPVGKGVSHGRLPPVWDTIRPAKQPDVPMPVQSAVVHSGRLYVGTSTRGLLCFDPRTEQWNVYGMEEGLPSLSVESIVPLDAETLYCSAEGYHYTFHTGDGSVTLVRQSNPGRKESVPPRMLFAWQHTDRWMGLATDSVWGSLLDPAAQVRPIRPQYGPKMQTRDYWTLGDAVSAAEIGSRRFFTCRHGLCEFDAGGTIVRCWLSSFDERLMQAARAANFEVPGYAPVFERARIFAVGSLLVLWHSDWHGEMVSAYDPSADTWYGPLHTRGEGVMTADAQFGAVPTEHGLWTGGRHGACFIALADILGAAKRTGRVMTTAELQQQLQRRLDAATPLERAKMYVRMRQYARAKPLLDELLADDPEHEEALSVQQEMEKRQ